jgi:hypothetical protein
MNNLSFSMIVDKDIKKNNNTVYERERYSWVKNDSVTHCYKCKSAFWFYLRKHHCRSCGQIFCYNCTDKYIELPTDIEKYPDQPEYWTSSIENIILWKDTVKQRVCDSCYTHITNIKKVKNLINMFEIINIDIIDIHNIIQVCK